MKTSLNSYIYQSFGKRHKVFPVIDKYSTNGTLAVILMCKEEGYVETYTTLTVNIMDSDLLGTNAETIKSHAYIDTNNNREAVAFLKNNGIAKPVIQNGKAVEGQSGFCSYPLYKFDLTKLNTREEFDRLIERENGKDPQQKIIDDLTEQLKVKTGLEYNDEVIEMLDNITITAKKNKDTEVLKLANDLKKALNPRTSKHKEQEIGR